MAGQLSKREYDRQNCDTSKCPFLCNRYCDLYCEKIEYYYETDIYGDIAEEYSAKRDKKCIADITPNPNLKLIKLMETNNELLRNILKSIPKNNRW